MILNSYHGGAYFVNREEATRKCEETLLVVLRTRVQANAPHVVSQLESQS